jgi:protein phosphatase-4 regulatory subunit 3
MLMAEPLALPRERTTQLQQLVELLSFTLLNHGHRTTYFILGNTIMRHIVSLLYVKDKPLRHGEYRLGSCHECMSGYGLC